MREFTASGEGSLAGSEPAVAAMLEHSSPWLIGHDPRPGEGFSGVPVFEPARYLSDTPKMFEYLRSKLGDDVELCHDIHEQLNPTDAARLSIFRRWDGWDTPALMVMDE